MYFFKTFHFSTNLVCCLFLGIFSLSAQQVVQDRIIPVKGYNIFEMGHPYGVVPVGSGKFAFVQYWNQGENRPMNHYYLQCLAYNNYEGAWFQPVSTYDRERFQVKGVHRLGKSLIVVGNLFIPGSKTYQTVFNYFSLDGKPSEKGTVQVSNWNGKNKILEEEYIQISPNNRRLLWMAIDNGKYFMSAWDDQANKLWEKQIDLSFVNKRYGLQDFTITNEGLPIFLMENEKPAYNLKDTLYPPLIVRYHPKRDKYHTDTVRIDSAFSYHTEMKLQNNQELVLSGIWGRDETKGLPNGAKVYKNPQMWEGFFFKKLQLVNTDSIRTLIDSLSPFPEKWLAHYGEEGSNFADFRLETFENKKGNHVLFIMEEMYSDKKRVYFYDIACTSFDLKDGHIKWAKRIPKRQRANGGADMLSFLTCMTTNNIHFVYLSERGARGKLVSTSLSLRDGKRRDFKIASNEAADYLIYPERSANVANAVVVLLGKGNPGLNDYKLMTVRLE